ncbi:MAG: thiol oxidoreductase [Rhodospirillaceae bacterium]|nr:thiol oxidoreductase [Rhodospirillaceae bacterium]
MRSAAIIIPLLVIAALATIAMSPHRRAAILAPTSSFEQSEKWESLSGGTTTNRKRFDRDAFSQPASNLSFEDRSPFFVGNGLFRRLWVTAPASTKSSDGLGPVFNARACQRCHLKDGRGHPPANAEDNAISMLLRLSIPPSNEAQRHLITSGRKSVIAEPTYGGQLQDLAVPGFAAEGRITVTYEEEAIDLPGGYKVSLRKPTYQIDDLAHGPLHRDAMLSPRVAPPMIGLGLLEAIAEKDILAKADPEDSDGDGISGKANRVWSSVEDQLVLGRFGWKAGQPSLAEQNAGAMSGDIGISNPIRPEPWGDCTTKQTKCRSAPHGTEGNPEKLEATAQIMDLILFYTRTLAVPERRNVDSPQVLRGKELFYASGCISCHTPKFATRRDYETEALAGQLIWPYTDLLLHDMGEGLADHRPEGRATGREWRTPPLWGIGLTKTVNGHTQFLHDGRARNLTEAILWHGGEAKKSRDTFAKMPAEDRNYLLAFLNSL